MYYLKITDETYNLYFINESKADYLEPDPGDIKISDSDHEKYNAMLSAETVVQVIEKERRKPEAGLLGYLEIFNRNQPYFRIFDTNTFGFVFPGVFKIMSTDIKISREDYDVFLKRQSEGTQYRLKEKLPEIGGLLDFIEEFTPEPIEVPPSENELLKEQLKQQQLATAEAIEKQEKDKTEQQLAQAEMLETILQLLEPQEGGE